MTTDALHTLLVRRWSPTRFEARPLPDGALTLLLEAARWAPSCFNEQPWRFIIGRCEHAEEFDRLAGCLNPKNRQWASGASLLLLTVAKQTFTRNGKPNRHALHDVGLSVAQLTMQATHLGLGVHQMAGFDAQRARSTYGIPDDFTPVSVLAVGFPSDPNEPRVHQRERRPLDTFAFGADWGKPSSAIAGDD